MGFFGRHQSSVSAETPSSSGDTPTAKVDAPSISIEGLAAAHDVDGLIDALSYRERMTPSSPRPGHEGFDEWLAGVEAVMRGAVVALAELGDPRAIVPILHCFDLGGLSRELSQLDDNPKGWPAVALSMFGPAAVEPLVATLEHHSPRMQTLAAIALGHIGDSRAVPALLAKAGDPKETVWALGQIGGNGEVIEFLISALESQNSKTQTYATHGLGSGRYGEAGADALVKCAERGEYSLGRQPSMLAVAALCEQGDPRGLELFLAKGPSSFDPYLLMAIGNFDDPRVRPLLHQALESPDAGEYGRKVYAAAGLAANGDLSAVRPLVEALTAYDSDRRIQWLASPRTEFDLASKALRDLGPAAIGPLMALAKDDPEPGIRSAAQSVLNVIREGWQTSS